MSIPDEEGFEAYLRQFDPLAPDPLPETISQEPRRRFAVGIAAAAAVTLVGFLGIRDYRSHVSGNLGNTVSREARAPMEPLTIRTADALLRSHASYKDALDDMASSEYRPQIPAGKQSAIAVLGKERIKL